MLGHTSNGAPATGAALSDADGRETGEALAHRARRPKEPKSETTPELLRDGV
jgi:hypothetical protein